MNAQDLKNSILQLAVQGKLVEQRPEEGTAKELLAQIKAEKEQLIKDKKIKKEKPLPEITEEEIPFEIPESWEWVRLSEIISFKMGKTPPRGDDVYWGSDYKWVSISDMRDGSVITDTKEGVTEKAMQEKFKEIVPKGTMIMSFKLTVGKVSILGVDAVHNEAIISVFPFIDKDYSLRDYLFKILPYMSVYGETKKAIMGFTLNSDSLSRLMIPLPPFEEQKRIVAKIEELLPYIEQYDKAYTKLEAFNKKFPEDMKKSILQMAMQGKLVEQRPEDGTAEELYGQIVAEKARLIKEGKIKKEKPLAEITEDDVPFEIPVSWKWVSVGSVCINIQYGSSQKSEKSGKMAVLRMGNIQNGRLMIDNLVYTSDDAEIEKYPLSCNDLLFNRTNSREKVGKTAIYKGEIPAIYAGYLVRITPLLIDSDYLNYIMQTQYYWSYCQTVRSDAIGQSNINAEKLKRFVFPLPPLAEQKRIVAKLEQMLPYCDQLIK